MRDESESEEKSRAQGSIILYSFNTQSRVYIPYSTQQINTDAKYVLVDRKSGLVWSWSWNIIYLLLIDCPRIP
jgi:hypothetical protein